MIEYTCTCSLSHRQYDTFQVRLIDAGFVWTEPHSQRIKVKLTIQKEVQIMHFL